MKSYLTSGSFIAIGNAVVTLVLYLGGFHSDATKLSTANYVSIVIGLGLSITFLIIGTRAKRAHLPVDQEFTYGQALATGVMISLFAALFGTAFQFIYQSFINPGFGEVVIQAQSAKFQASGLSSDQIEKAEKITRMMTKPAFQAVFSFFGGIIFGVILSLITAAFLRRKGSAQLPTTPAL
jgi:hypothetical protein